MKSYFEKNILIWSAIIFFAIVALLFYVTENKKYEAPKENPTPISPSQSSSEHPTRVEEDQGNHTSVRYDQGQFSPPEITIKTENGCFVEIQNASNKNLIPRLGPYNPDKEQGFLYPAIAPGKTSLIDPRYGARITFSFYDKNNPGGSFIVHIDPTCL